MAAVVCLLIAEADQVYYKRAKIIKANQALDIIGWTNIGLSSPSGCYTVALRATHQKELYVTSPTSNALGIECSFSIHQAPIIPVKTLAISRTNRVNANYAMQILWKYGSQAARALHFPPNLQHPSSPFLLRSFSQPLPPNSARESRRQRIWDILIKENASASFLSYFLQLEQSNLTFRSRP